MFSSIPEQFGGLKGLESSRSSPQNRVSLKYPGLNPSLLQQAWIQAFGHFERTASWDKFTNIFKMKKYNFEENLSHFGVLEVGFCHDTFFGHQIKKSVKRGKKKK